MSNVRLQNRHLWIAAELASGVFADAAQVYLVYYPQQKALLLAPISDELFPTVHKAGIQMLKTRNLQGDKSIPLAEILLDYDLAPDDRPLMFIHQPGLQLLHISL